MPSLRLIAWNCNHGSLSTRLSELAECSPDIVFLQECAPTETLPLTGQFFTRRLNGAKGIALGSLNPNYHLTDLTPRPTSGAAVLGATVTGPVSFTVLGVWGQKPYADDVMRTLDAYDDLLRSGSSVVMGDLNSGTPLGRNRPHRQGHKRILSKFADLGFVSAYHVFHEIEHGQEQHATYRHRPTVSEPWHIDFCFVPATWVASLVRVVLMDGDKWTARRDHLPLKVDLSFADAVA